MYTFRIETIHNINADLNIIAKYHKGTSLQLDKIKNKNKINTQVDIKQLYISINKNEEEVTDDFSCGNLIKLLNSEEHAANLLILVRNMINLEWAYYQSYQMETTDIKSINLYKELESLLKELKILKSQSVSEKILQTKIKLRVKNPLTKIVTDFEDGGITIDNVNENQEIIQLLINNRVRLIKDLEHLYIPITTVHPEDWTDEIINKILPIVHQTFDDQRAKWRFGRFVAKTILNYLNEETDLNPQNVDLTQDQAVIIYTLLLLFGIQEIEFAGEYNMKSSRQKAKIIRSFIRSDLDNEEKEFYEFSVIKKMSVEEFLANSEQYMIAPANSKK
ncbi:hypothetical protein [Pedobacter miscanthi]|uniref:Uncharacterized protein n=1 Tax=Pedobacter miscanthi TaxID=2259170 RepID=A0A366KWE5_9SPHI|nr:hypothetical protein [Pedobacter miscanthi]RBQ05840.1 hypothetical protein DRW42_15185 [Pedobacter miscanthi]